MNSIEPDLSLRKNKFTTLCHIKKLLTNWPHDWTYRRETSHQEAEEEAKETAFVCWKSSLTIIRCLIGARAHTPDSILGSKFYQRRSIILGWELRRCVHVVLFVALCTVLWTTIYTFSAKLLHLRQTSIHEKHFTQRFAAIPGSFIINKLGYCVTNKITGVAFWIFVFVEATLLVQSAFHCATIIFLLRKRLLKYALSKSLRKVVHFRAYAVERVQKGSKERTIGHIEMERYFKSYLKTRCEFFATFSINEQNFQEITSSRFIRVACLKKLVLKSKCTFTFPQEFLHPFWRIVHKFLLKLEANVKSFTMLTMICSWYIESSNLWVDFGTIFF